MKNIPNTIYLQVGEDITNVKDFNDLDPEEVTWSPVRQFKTDIVFYLKKRSSKRRRSSPKGRQSNVRKADVARRAKRRTE